VFGPSVRVVLGLCTDLARTQLGHGWLIKQSIHQNSVRVQSEHSLWTVHGLHRVRTESVRIRWGSVKTSNFGVSEPACSSLEHLFVVHFFLCLVAGGSEMPLNCATGQSGSFSFARQQGCSLGCSERFPKHGLSDPQVLFPMRMWEGRLWLC
jgi:hypothetical protein